MDQHHEAYFESNIRPKLQEVKKNARKKALSISIKIVAFFLAFEILVSISRKVPLAGVAIFLIFSGFLIFSIAYFILKGLYHSKNENWQSIWSTFLEYYRGTMGYYVVSSEYRLSDWPGNQDEDMCFMSDITPELLNPHHLPYANRIVWNGPHGRIVSTQYVLYKRGNGNNQIKYVRSYYLMNSFPIKDYTGLNKTLYVVCNPFITVKRYMGLNCLKYGVYTNDDVLVNRTVSQIIDICLEMLTYIKKEAEIIVCENKLRIQLYDGTIGPDLFPMEQTLHFNENRLKDQMLFWSVMFRVRNIL